MSDVCSLTAEPHRWESMNFAAMGPRITPTVRAGNASPRNHFCLILTEIMPYRIVNAPGDGVRFISRYDEAVKCHSRLPTKY
jgi:hypothetical protein